MIFWDELVHEARPIDQIALIDHNALDERQAKQLGSNSQNKVKYVYDHHVDLKYYPVEQTETYIVKFIGSACSILVNEMRSD